MSRRGRKRRSPVRLWPGTALGRRSLRVFRGLPLFLQGVTGTALILVVAVALNWTYQVIRKPSELFFPVSGTLNKTPVETWDHYAFLFRWHATSVITPDLLAALAQVEASGNPVARTYWRWSMTSRPFDLYRPASSAVGMYQFTDGTFAEARRYCIHDHRVVEDGPWNAPRSCWFNSLYARVLPSDAVELASAHLDRSVANALSSRQTRTATLGQKQNLAAVIHLCGAGAGVGYARRGFRLLAGQQCGSHEVRGYLDRVNRMKAVFRCLAEGRARCG